MNIHIPKEIFIISLKKYFKFSKQRTDFLLSKLLNLKFDISTINFVGINGVRLKNKKINSKYISLEKYNFNQNIGTLGCALSHIMVLKLAQIRKINNDILILEEDACINKNFNFLYSYLPEDYDIIYLHSYDETFFYKQTIQDDSNVYFRKINKPLLYNFIPGGTSALLVNGRNINKILNTILPVKEAIDWHYINLYDKLNQYYIKPELDIFLNPPLESVRYAMDTKYR